ncbi:MAG: hypothetical protein ABSG45_03235 [Nitrososphaerales archaeon]
MSNATTETGRKNWLPREPRMVADMEAVEQALPFEEYAEDTERLSELVGRLEHLYDKREKIIDHIVEYGTGIESEKALRMYSIPVLEQWEAALESFRAQQLKNQSGNANLRADIAMLRSEIARLKAAQAKASAAERVKMQARIDELHGKLHSKLAGIGQKVKEQETTAAAKARGLESKAAAKRSEASEAVKARIASVKSRRQKKNEADPAPEGGLA